MALMQWHIVTRDQYDAGTPVDGHMYFITGENTIYRGTEQYNKAIEFYTGELPTSPAPHRLYVSTETFAGKMWDGSKWSDVIKPLSDTVSADITGPVTGAAVTTYVAEQIAAITGSGTVLTGATWDPDNKVLTFAKGDGKNVTVTLTGLGVDLTYDNTTGKLGLKDSSGAAIGEGVNLALEKFVHGGEYNAETKNIILYFDDKKTDKIEIPVGDLVDTYTAENSATLNLEVISNVIKGKVNVSAKEGNTLTAETDGLYVPTTDISGKADKDADAVEGNIAVFDTNGNPIDSGKSFEDIGSNSSVYYSDVSLEEAIKGHTPVAHDVAIVRTQIGESGKYQRTAYIYNGESWEKMDENYNAENVYFADDLITTSAIGNIKLTNGQATITAKGKNLKEVFNTIFVKEQNPTTTQPAVSVTLSGAGSLEAGTVFTPNYTATLSAGSYTYGPATGITASSWEVTDTDSHSATENAGKFDAFTVEDGKNYTVTAKASYGNGAVPLTNTGNTYAAGQIKAGSKSGTSKAVTAHRKTFYGTTANKDELTSDAIRALAGKSSGALTNGAAFTVEVPVGAMRVVIAYPATLRDMTSALDVNGMNAESVSSFKLQQVNVEGANKYTAIAYKVYTLEFAAANDKKNSFKITL